MKSSLIKTNREVRTLVSGFNISENEYFRFKYANQLLIHSVLMLIVITIMDIKNNRKDSPGVA